MDSVCSYFSNRSAIALIESELKREAKILVKERREAELKNGEKGQ